MTDQIRADLAAAMGERVASVDPIPEGHSGFTYFVKAESGDYVLRLPPPGARIAGTADVMRQGRIMAALHDAGLPTPAVPIICSDPIVDGRPFVLMERIKGERIETTAEREKPIDIARHAVDTLKQLQALPLDRTGIGDEDPIPLQVEMMRWAMLMQRSPEELTMRAGELGGLLAAQVPAERTPTLVHGDYHYGNMLFRGSEIAAILDWEIAEIGQPLLDLGCLCIVAIRRQYQGAPNPGGAIDVSMDELYQLYGVDAEEMRWYAAMSLYKYASIFGYNLNLHRKGRRPDPMYEGLTDTIVGMIGEGISLL
ncbi:MAG TPA: phosphotransferase family protein [Candidatus Dormibacteraeota bacterium]|nr:phosphotransferase family protein [Candidatus Dormibacteraeota bacterium]